MKFDIVEFGFCNDEKNLNLEGIPPLERRKMSKITRFVYSCLYGFKNLDLPMILASNYGELSQCIKMLSTLSESSFVSPNSFCASVLNAPAAAIGILKQNHHPIFAISSNLIIESAAFCAFSKLSEFEKILIAAYDENIYAQKSKALAFVIQNGGGCELLSSANTEKNDKNSIELFLENFKNKQNYQISDDKISFQWNFNAKIP